MPSTLTMELMEARLPSVRSHIVEWPTVPQSTLTNNRAGEQVEPNSPRDPSTPSALSRELEQPVDHRPLLVQETNGSTSETVEFHFSTPPNVPVTQQEDEADRPPQTNDRIEPHSARQVTSANPSPQLQELEVNGIHSIVQPLAAVEIHEAVHELSISERGAATPRAQAEAPGVQVQAPEIGWLSLKRFTTKTRWLEPQLSCGAQCDRIGGNECWEAIGPALTLSNRVSRSIAELLNTLIIEIEDAQPVADNPLAFRLFMIGKSRSTARPTILIISQSQISRRRAIKFVKDSKILKGHPKIALAESAVFPMVAGRGRVLLLAASPGLIVGSVIGSIGFLAVVWMTIFWWLRGRRNYRSELPVELPPPLSAQPVDPYLPSSLLRSRYLKATGSPTFTSPAPNYGYDPTTSSPWSQDLSKTTNTMRRMVLPAAPSIAQYNPWSSDYSTTINTIRRQSLSETTSNPQYIPLTEFTRPETNPGQNSTPLSIDSRISELRGKSIICPSTGQHARIGGLVYSLTGSYYGFTAAHVFQKLPGSNSNKSGNIDADTQDTDSEFAFDEDEEEDEEGSSTADIAATSSASMSSSASLSQTTTAKSSTSIAVPPQVPQIPVQVRQSLTRKPDPVPATRVAHPILSSLRGTDLGLDWALIDPIVSDHRFARFKLQGFHRVTHPPQPMPETETNVIMPVGNNVSVKGKLWPGVTMMKLSQRSKFIQLWSISVDTPIVEGDSGTWVLDAKDGKMYGHIVAGVAGSGNAFIVPAQQVCADMESEIGPVELVHFTLEV